MTTTAPSSTPPTSPPVRRDRAESDRRAERTTTAEHRITLRAINDQARKRARMLRPDDPEVPDLSDLALALDAVLTATDPDRTCHSGPNPRPVISQDRALKHSTVLEGRLRKFNRRAAEHIRNENAEKEIALRRSAMAWAVEIAHGWITE